MPTNLYPSLPQFSSNYAQLLTSIRILDPKKFFR